MESRLTSFELREILEGLLGLTTMTIATSGSDAEPHAAAVYFVCDNQLNFFFFSSPQSQHSGDISDQPRVAVTIHPECFEWQDIHGLQVRGAITPVKGRSEWQQAWELYQIKFPFVSDLKEILSRNLLHKFRPDWIRLVDNRRGFGFKQEWVYHQDEKTGSEPAACWRTANESGISESGYG